MGGLLLQAILFGTGFNALPLMALAAKGERLLLFSDKKSRCIAAAARMPCGFGSFTCLYSAAARCPDTFS
jgi:hypothetical protein